MKSKFSTAQRNAISVKKHTSPKNTPSLKYIAIAVLAGITGMAQATTDINSSNNPQTFNSDTDYLIDDGIDTDRLTFSGQTPLTVTNKGNVSSADTNSAAIAMDASGTLINYGNVTGSAGNNAHGAVEGAAKSTIINEASGNIYGSALGVSDSSNSSNVTLNITNYGDISSTGLAGDGVKNGSIGFGSGSQGSLENYGTINGGRAGTVGSTAHGVLVKQTGGTVTINNHQGASILSGADVPAIFITQYADTVNITNDGLINGVMRNSGSAMKVTNNQSGTISSVSQAGVELASKDTLINHGHISSGGTAAIVFRGNNATTTLGSGSTLSGTNNDAILSKGTGNTVTLSNSDSKTIVENGNFASDTDDHGLGKLTADASSHWLLDGDISLAGTTANTLDVAGNLILGGTVSQHNSSGGTTIEKGGSLQLGNGGTGGIVTGAILDNGTLTFDHSDNLIYSEVISGSGDLIQSGSGTLTLTENNTYSGKTVIESGSTLALGNGGSTGMVSGPIVDNGTLSMDHRNALSYDSVISGSGGLTHTGSGTLTLTGDNTFTGQTVVDSGSTLSLGDGGTTGSVAGNITNNGALLINHSNNVVESAVLSGNGSLTQSGTGVVTLTGQNSSQGVVNVASGTLDFAQSGKFNAASLIVDKQATVVMQDDARLAISGNATVNGELDVDVSTGGPLITADSVTLGASATLDIAGLAGNTATKASDVDGERTTVLQTTNGIMGDFASVDLGTNTSPDYLLLDGVKSADSKSYSVGYELAWTSSTEGANGQFTLGTGDHFDVDMALADQSANAVTGWDGKSLTKSGKGDLTLSAVNTYTGKTDVQQGTLSTGIAHALDSSREVNVATGATLALNGFDQNLKVLSGAGNVTLGKANLGVSGGGQYDGVISGSGTLNKSGANTLVLGGNNTFTGTTTVSDGTLQIGNGATSGSIAGNLADNAAVAFNRSDKTAYNGTISGKGSVSQQGKGTLSLGGNNTYSGGTSVDAGTLALTKAQAAGTGAIDVASQGVLDLSFSNATFSNALDGAGKVVVSGKGITLADDATGLSGQWDIKGSASASQQDQLGSANVMLDGAGSILTVNNMSTLTNALTGNGTLQIHENAKTDAFSFASSMGSAFTGTVAVQKGDVILDDNAEQALSHANLALSPEGTATMDSNRTIDGLTTGGGTLRIDNTRTDAHTLTTRTLDASAGGTLAVNIPSGLTPPVVSVNPSYFDQDAIRTVQVVNTTGTVIGEGNHLTLQNYDGSSASNATVINIEEGGSQLGTATYDNAAVVTDDGAWVGYDLVQLSANAGQTVILQNEVGMDDTLVAQLSGAGNFAIQANGTVMLNNVTSDYTGNTLIDSGNVQLGSDNALGHTADVSLANSTGLDINGWSQTIGSLHGEAGSTLNLNKGNLTLTNGGESFGTLSGNGILNLEGGDLNVHGANQGLSAATTIASAATATLDNAQGLGTGDITLDGNLKLDGANGTLSNQISGAGTLALENSAAITLSNRANTLAGDIRVATGTQLTAQGEGSMGSASVTNDGTLVIDTAADWTLANNISGTGDLNKIGAGTVTVGDGQTYSGDTHINEGAMQVAGAFNATGTVYVGQNGTLKGAGSVAGSVDNSGVIDLTSDTTGNALTINGDYTGNNGQLWVNSELADDSSVHDALFVKGNTHGTTQVTVNDMHGLGGQTVNGIELVDVQGQSDGAFTLNGRAVAGAYEYSLNQASDGNWYLQSTTDAPDPIPDPSVDPVPAPQSPILRPEAGAYLANQSLANSVFVTTMHDRNGENRQSGDDAPATWAHFDAGRTNSKAGGDAITLGSNTSVLRVGTDVVRHDFGDQRINAGVMFGYADADTDSNAKHVSGKATGNMKGYNFGVYGTWYGGSAEQKSGPYIDSWMQYGSFHNSVQGDDLAEEKYHAHNWAGSVEVGYDMPVSGFESLTLQPQFQTIYTSYSQDAHHEANGTKIQSKDAGGTTTRLGARLYGELGDSYATQPFVELNWWHGGSSNSVQMDSTTVDQSIPVNRYEAKVGAQTKVSKNWVLWINAGVETGKDDYSSVEGVIGGKYNW